MKKTRPDLSSRQITLLASGVGSVALVFTLLPNLPAPGSPIAQLCATIGGLLLLAPLLFVVVKRTGRTESPPAWFRVHVLATCLGSSLVFAHAAAGDWFTPPGLLLLLMFFLVLQGSLLRTVASRGFSLLFARSSAATGFVASIAVDKTGLRNIIDNKINLLGRLQPDADEALFSPTLAHWARNPGLSLRYQLLANREARMVGARCSVGLVLGWSRIIHMLAALAFYIGLMGHVIIVLFFAGYAAEGEPVDWWYITAWGGAW